MNTNVNHVPVNRPIYIASNVINIVASLFFVLLIFLFCMGDKTKDIVMIKEFSIIIIPLILTITFKFVFGIMNGRNILQFKIVQNGLLFLILNVILIVLPVVLFFSIKYEQNGRIPLIIGTIISFLCLIIAIFTIIERIRGKNDIHLFFLIFYTLLILVFSIVCVSKII